MHLSQLIRQPNALTVTGQPPGLPPPCPWPRSPCQPLWAISSCFSDDTAGPASSFPQPRPAQPWVLLRQVHSQAQVPAQTQPPSIPRDLPDAWVCLSCPTPGWGDGTGPGCQFLPSATQERPQGAADPLIAPRGISGSVCIPRVELKWGSGPQTGVE